MLVGISVSLGVQRARRILRCLCFAPEFFNGFFLVVAVFDGAVLCCTRLWCFCMYATE